MRKKKILLSCYVYAVFNQYLVCHSCNNGEVFNSELLQPHKCHLYLIMTIDLLRVIITLKKGLREEEEKLTIPI